LNASWRRLSCGRKSLPLPLFWSLRAETAGLRPRWQQRAACPGRHCGLCCCWLIGAVVVLQEVLEEGKSAVSLEEVHEIASDAVHSIKDACARGRS